MRSIGVLAGWTAVTLSLTGCLGEDEQLKTGAGGTTGSGGAVAGAGGSVGGTSGTSGNASGGASDAGATGGSGGSGGSTGGSGGSIGGTSGSGGSGGSVGSDGAVGTAGSGGGLGTGGAGGGTGGSGGTGGQPLACAQTACQEHCQKGGAQYALLCQLNSCLTASIGGQAYECYGCMSALQQSCPSCMLYSCHAVNTCASRPSCCVCMN